MDKYVVAQGSSVITIRGVLAPGEEINKNDLKSPDNFMKLLEKGKIIRNNQYIDNEDSQYRAPEIKEEEKQSKKEIKKEEKNVVNKPGLGAKK